MARGKSPYPDSYIQLGDSILPRAKEPTRKWNWRKPVTTDCGGSSRTKQSMKDDCDINLIVKRHASTGMWTHLNPIRPVYGDFTGVQQLQDAMALVDSAEEHFYSLPAEVRRLCNNDPAVFLSEVNDPEGIMALVDAGLPMAEGWEPPAGDGEKETPKEAEGASEGGVT